MPLLVFKVAKSSADNVERINGQSRWKRSSLVNGEGLL
jgi:hypothetical protein